MADKTSCTFGIFSDRLSTESAIEALRAAGFRNSDISALFPDEIRTRTFYSERRTKAVYGAAAGCSGGAVLGGLAGWIAGLSAIALAGPLVGGCVLGAVVGAWIGNMLPAIEEHYENLVHRGDILVAVQCQDPAFARKARGILKRTGGEAVASNSRPMAVFHTPSRSIRPVREKTLVPSLRLVHPKSSESGPLPTTSIRKDTLGETKKKSAAS